MKKTIVLLMAAMMILSLCMAGCDKEKKTVATEGVKYAEKTLKAYKKLMGEDAIADNSYIMASYENENTYFKISGGELSEQNPDYVLEIRAEHIKISHDDLNVIHENTLLYLAPGSKLPEGFETNEALAQAKEALRLYQMPVKDGDDPRVMPDGAIFVVEVNNKTYYYMCKDNAIGDENPDYKALVESKNYVLDETDFFSFTVSLYFNLDNIPGNDTETDNAQKEESKKDKDEAKAKELANQAVDTYIKKASKEEPIPYPVDAIVVVQYNGKTYYFKTQEVGISDANKEYKKLTESDDYKKSSINVGDGVTLYLKKTK